MSNEVIWWVLGTVFVLMGLAYWRMNIGIKRGIDYWVDRRMREASWDYSAFYRNVSHQETLAEINRRIAARRGEKHVV